MTDPEWREHCDGLVRSMESEPRRGWQWRLVTIGSALVRIGKAEGTVLGGLVALATVGFVRTARPFAGSNTPDVWAFVTGAAAASCAFVVLRLTKRASKMRSRGHLHWGWQAFGYFVVVPGTCVLVSMVLGLNWRDGREFVAATNGLWAALFAWVATASAWALLDGLRTPQMRWLAWGQIPDQARIIRAAIHGRERRWWARRNFLRWVSTQSAREWTPDELQSILSDANAHPSGRGS